MKTRSSSFCSPVNIRARMLHFPNAETAKRRAYPIKREHQTTIAKDARDPSCCVQHTSDRSSNFHRGGHPGPRRTRTILDTKLGQPRNARRAPRYPPTLGGVWVPGRRRLWRGRTSCACSGRRAGAPGGASNHQNHPGYLVCVASSQVRFPPAQHGSIMRGLGSKPKKPAGVLGSQDFDAPSGCTVL